MEKEIRCYDCKGMNIQVLAWVDANTNEYKGEAEDCVHESQWCDDCEKHVNFIFNNKEE